MVIFYLFYIIFHPFGKSGKSGFYLSLRIAETEPEMIVRLESAARNEKYAGFFAQAVAELC